MFAFVENTASAGKRLINKIKLLDRQLSLLGTFLEISLL